MHWGNLRARSHDTLGEIIPVTSLLKQLLVDTPGEIIEATQIAPPPTG